MGLTEGFPVAKKCLHSCLCLDWTGPWKTDPGQAEVLREGTEGESKRREKGKRHKKEETQLFGYHEDSGGIK